MFIATAALPTYNKSIMGKLVFSLLLALATVALTKPTTTRTTEVPREFIGVDKGSQKDVAVSTDQDNNSELNYLELMDMCNESFRIEMDYLKALNESGSFLDETDKTPKCFLRCMLENTGILMDDGMINTARAAIVFAGERSGKPMEDIGDMTALCGADRNEKCLCERSYNFMRCLMSMEVDKYGMSL